MSQTSHATIASYTNREQRHLNTLTITITLIASALMLLTGCGTTQAPGRNNEGSAVALGAAAAPLVLTVEPPGTATATVIATAGATQTVIATAVSTEIATLNPDLTPNYLTPIVATHEAYATRVRGFREALRTSIALTHEPTYTPGRPPIYPSPTPMLGMLPGCSNADPYSSQGISCWRGVIDGQLVEVGAGREGLRGDSTQGIVKVHIRGQQGEDIYRTPQRVGAVRINSVSGTMFTLTTISQPTPQTFVFDLATRQWVSP